MTNFLSRPKEKYIGQENNTIYMIIYSSIYSGLDISPIYLTIVKCLWVPCDLLNVVANQPFRQ